jgi:threonine/homoserine/homoserine lactone efflux protein
VELSVLAAFTAVAATLVVLPGPDWALVLSAGTRTGRSGVAATVGGLALGYVLLTGVVAAGVAPLIAARPAALAVLTVVGAGYLLYVGASILRSPASVSPEHRPNAPDGRLAAVRRGLGVSAMNPKSLLFFLAFLPQFARAKAPWPFSMQLLTLGGIWILLVAIFYTLLGNTAAIVLAERPRLARAVTLIAGAAMLVAAVALLGEQLIK